MSCPPSFQRHCPDHARLEYGRLVSTVVERKPPFSRPFSMIRIISVAYWYESHLPLRCQNGYGYEPMSSSLRKCIGMWMTMKSPEVSSFTSPVNMIRLRYM